ncbi:polysaccharide pyruvyl transferase family protein [Mangrovivirga cuniculi]|uniref:Polysaccharide pyruvyl transferase domain-containing protein n=1 Tax=Mangrovivirga cuniculi TaxID=2715131 RepID=A0A4D7JWG7_9BACT|nr:polysaccharide pyruvyl transferase family protein [Mangrovivirga cuniculi]QCK16486.1 hypothetical protein DCC35_17995 [Mangrovivirga cuniculi]
MSDKILIKGYYGFGNFGDDVLMVTTINLIKSIKKDSELHIFSNSESNQYLNKLIDYEFKVVNWENTGNYSYLVHGGGGTYFDFKKGSFKNLVINSFIKTIGIKNYSTFFTYLKRIMGRPILSFKKRLGIGIGVGSFTSTSRKFRDAAVELGTFDFLAVRDDRSLKRINEMNLKTNPFRGIDLAFLKKYWLPNTVETDLYTDARKIGFILRHWDGDDQYLNALLKDVKNLKDKGYEISLILFDKNHDKGLLDFRRYFDEVLIWDPWVDQCDLNWFLQKLKEYTVLVTSRAHGAIIPAMLGIPSVIIELEEKLRNVHEMLKNSSKLIKINQLGKGELPIIVDEYISDIIKIKTKTQKDISYNENQAGAMIAAFFDNFELKDE